MILLLLACAHTPNVDALCALAATAPVSPAETGARACVPGDGDEVISSVARGRWVVMRTSDAQKTGRCVDLDALGPAVHELRIHEFHGGATDGETQVCQVFAAKTR